MNLSKRLSATVTLAIALALTVSVKDVNAQSNAQPQVSVVTLQAVKNQRGGTSVVTPKGILAPLPGAGVNGGTAQIYIGSNGGYWYTDKTGQTVDLTPAVKAFQARTANIPATQVPQNAPVPYQQAPQQQTTQQTQSSGGSSALGTAAAPWVRQQQPVLEP